MKFQTHMPKLCYCSLVCSLSWFIWLNNINNCSLYSFSRPKSMTKTCTIRPNWLNRYPKLLYVDSLMRVTTYSNTYMYLLTIYLYREWISEREHIAFSNFLCVWRMIFLAFFCLRSSRSLEKGLTRQGLFCWFDLEYSTESEYTYIDVFFVHTVIEGWWYLWCKKQFPKDVDTIRCARMHSDLTTMKTIFHFFLIATFSWAS